jgi:hypothetical protein
MTANLRHSVVPLITTIQKLFSADLARENPLSNGLPFLLTLAPVPMLRGIGVGNALLRGRQWRSQVSGRPATDFGGSFGGGSGWKRLDLALPECHFSRV